MVLQFSLMSVGADLVPHTIRGRDFYGTSVQLDGSRKFLVILTAAAQASLSAITWAAWGHIYGTVFRYPD